MLYGRGLRFLSTLQLLRNYKIFHRLSTSPATTNNFEALQTLEFEYKVKSRHDFVDQILSSSGELKILQETLDEIIALTKVKVK